MAKIEFLCLGGQDEKDKVCDALVIDGDIFVLGCGIHCPSVIQLGIKKIVADFSYLIDNKQKIKGIFIPTPNYNLYGGLEFLLKNLPNVPVFTSHLGQMIINNNLDWCFRQRGKRLDHNNSLKTRFNINAVKPLETFKLGKVEILPFRTASFMPTSLGFVFNTDVGSIVYVDHFIIPTSVNNATYDLLEQVVKFTKNNVLMLITSIGKNINHKGFTSPCYNIDHFYENCVLDMPNRGIFVIEEEDIYKLTKLAAIAAKKTIPFYIYSPSLARAFNYMQQNKIVSFNNLLYINEQQINTIDRGIIVVSGDKQSLFTKLQKIVVGDDQRLTFKPTDTFVYSILTTPGYEKLEANLFDSINRLNVPRVVKIPKDIIQLSQSQEDHKFLINVLKPKYIIPINGLYMDFVNYKTLCNKVITPQKNIIILGNGQVATFDSGKFIDAKKHIKLVEQYVGNQGLYDVGASGLFECEQMADSGCVLASLLIDKQGKKIDHYNYNIVGVLNQADPKNQAIVDEINTTLNTIMLDLLKSLAPNTNLSRDQQDYFKKQIVKQYEKKFGKRPLVLLTIIYKDQIEKAKSDLG
ncbi:MAG: ribonuclease J [Mycoplasma sp.]|nr:ribonuclease J [Candidatus Hennigella equi]